MRKLYAIGLCAVLTMTSVTQAELLTWLAGDVANEADARVALDSSDKGNHAFLAQKVELTDDGRDGGALDFLDGNGADEGSYLKMNPATWGNFDGILDNQEFTIAFWMAAEESAVDPRNQSVFWFESPGNNGTSRGIQAHAPWSNGSVFLDIGGCCGGTERVSGPADREFWDSAEGEEWNHWAFTMNDNGDAAVYIDGEQFLFREGPTDEILEFQQVWFGSAINGGNSFAGRMDDIVVASNGLDEDGVLDLFENGPAAVWPDDIADSVPTDVVPNTQPVAELIKVAGIGNLGETVAPDSVEGLFYDIEVSSEFLDSDHLIKFDGPLDMSNSGIRVTAMDDLVPGDSWVPVLGSEVTGLDSMTVLLDDPSMWDISSLGVDGRIVYTGAAGAAQVPEPTGLALFGLGGLLVGLLRKRR